MSRVVTSNEPAPEPSTIEGPASAGQRLLWMFERNRAKSGALNLPVIVRLRRPLDRRAFQESVVALVERHEALRTRLDWRNRRLIRLVAAAWRPEVRFETLGEALDPMAELERALTAELTAGLDARQWPLRATTWTLAPDDHILCLNIHHAASDMVSNGFILAELALLYQAACERKTVALPPIEWQYSQWVEWQTAQLEGPSRERLLRYWMRHLEGAVSPQLRAAIDAGASGRLAGVAFRTLGEGVFDGIVRLALAERATPFAVFLALLYLTIFRATGQTDLTVTTMLSDRGRPEVRLTVGYFVNAVALRTSFRPAISFVDLVRACRTTLFGAMQHQTMPFHVLPPSVTANASGRIDDVALQAVGTPGDFPSPFEALPRRADFGGGRTFDLEIVVGRWSVSALYGTHRYDAAYIGALVDSFCVLASAAVATPSSSLDTLSRARTTAHAADGEVDRRA